MGFFCKTTLTRLYECHPLLVELMLYANRKSEKDFTIVCGYRSSEDQQKAYDDKKSKAKPGQSKHNRIPAEAIDIAPWPIDWHDTQSFIDLAYHVKGCAKYLGINIKWGGDPDWTGPPGDYGHFYIDL